MFIQRVLTSKIIILNNIYWWLIQMQNEKFLSLSFVRLFILPVYFSVRVSFWCYSLHFVIFACLLKFLWLISFTCSRSIFETHMYIICRMLTMCYWLFDVDVSLFGSRMKWKMRKTFDEKHEVQLRKIHRKKVREEHVRSRRILNTANLLFMIMSFVFWMARVVSSLFFSSAAQ